MPPKFQQQSWDNQAKDNAKNDLFYGKEDISSEEEIDEEDKKAKDAKKEEDEQNLDLETRIAMLLQNKDSSIAPPFLSLTDEQSDEETKKSSSSGETEPEELSGGEEKAAPPQEPLSTPPSPFLSQEIYLHWHKTTQELQQEAQKEENKERLKRLKKKIGKGKKKKEESSQINGVNDDDHMSLSSLSSTEDPILQQESTQETEPNPSAPYPPHFSYPSFPYAPQSQHMTPINWQGQQNFSATPVDHYSFGTQNYLSYPPPYVSNYPVPPPGQMPMYPNWPGYFPQGPGSTSGNYQSGLYHDPTIK